MVKKWQVGDSIYAHNMKHLISKVGRKWLEVSGHGYRVSIESLRDDRQYGSPSKFYATQEEMEQAQILGRRYEISTKVQDCLDVNKLKQIEDLLE